MQVMHSMVTTDLWENDPDIPVFVGWNIYAFHGVQDTSMDAIKHVTFFNIDIEVNDGVQWIAITNTPYIYHYDIYEKTLCKAWSIYKNIERHTANAIVSWPNPQHWQMSHTSDSILILRQSTLILKIIIRAMGKPNTHSP